MSYVKGGAIVAADRTGAVTIANKIIRAIGPDWCVRHLNVDTRGTVHLVAESHDASSGEPWADICIDVTYSIYPDSRCSGT